MKALSYIVIFILLSSCTKNPESFIEHLNGYWEIEKVVLPNGNTRSYTINETIDYIETTDRLTGFRKKLKPNFNGSYITSNNEEHFTLTIKKDSLHIYYKTPFANWKETILFANESQLKVINQNKAVFLYKRFTPLNLE